MANFISRFQVLRKAINSALALLAFGIILLAIMAWSVIQAWQAKDFVWRFADDHPNVIHWIENRMVPSIVIIGFLTLIWLIILGLWKLPHTDHVASNNLQLAAPTVPPSGPVLPRPTRPKGPEISSPTEELPVDPYFGDDSERERVRVVLRGLSAEAKQILNTLGFDGPQSVPYDQAIVILLNSRLVQKSGEGSNLGEVVIRINPEIKGFLAEYFTGWK